jgi:drug/metabolite transporter (DMT)-like permease
LQASVVLVVLLAAFFHAAWNAMVKSGSDHLLSMTGLNIASGLICLPLLPFVGLPDTASWPFLGASAVFHVGYYIALSQAYRYGDFSQAYPVARGTAPVLVTLWGLLVLGESLSPIELVSLVGVLTGIMVFASRRLDQVIHDRHALVSALMTSTFIAAYTLADGVGGRLSGNVLAYMLWLCALDSAMFIAYAVWRRGIVAVADTRHQWRTLVPGGALSLFAYTLVVWAMTQAPIPLVSALRETSIIIAALIGAFYFKEPSGMRRIIASIIIFFSVVLLVFDMPL